MLSLFKSVFLTLGVALALLFTSIISTAIAQTGFPIPEADIPGLLLQIATNSKALGVLGTVSVVTLLSVQAIKKLVNDHWPYKRLAVLSFAIIYSIISGMLIPGSNIASVAITVFITSGGAAALYEALKGAGVIKKAVSG